VKGGLAVTVGEQRVVVTSICCIRNIASTDEIRFGLKFMVLMVIQAVVVHIFLYIYILPGIIINL